MATELLPIGSVVQLADSTALVMIAGYLPISPSRPDYVWDYSGFKFPIGYTEDDSIFCFNQAQILTVYAHGYKDIEEEMFMSRLAAAREQANGMAEQASGEQAEKTEEA